MSSALVEYTPDTEALEPSELAMGWEAGGETESALDETDEAELASQMLEISDEHELDRFIGSLVSRAGRAVGAAASSQAGQALGGILKDAARQALPIAGRAFGAYAGGERGAQLGAQAAGAIGRLFGLELEGLSPEDKEFAVARQFVRFATGAVNNLAMAPPFAPAAGAAQTAATRAARQLAPGLLGADSRPAIASSSRPSSGRWFRRGRSIVIVNC
jgi:hypothetical protein